MSNKSNEEIFKPLIKSAKIFLVFCANMLMIIVHNTFFFLIRTIIGLWLNLSFQMYDKNVI